MEQEEPPAILRARPVVEPRAWHARFFERAPAAVSLSRVSDGRFLEVNESFLHLYGYSRDEVVGKTSADLNMWPDPIQRGRVAELVIAVGAVHSLEIDSRVKSGEVRRLVLSAEVVNEGEPCFLAILQDITEKERSRAAIASLAAELQRSNVELEQFAYAASHDLRAPLRSIETYARIIEGSRAAFDAETREALDGLIRESSRMREQIDRTLATSRVGGAQLDLASVDTDRLVASVLATLSNPIHATGARVTKGELPVVRADEGQLREVFQNLVENAIKFRSPLRAPEISIGAQRSDATWTFTVRDNGRGIDPSQRERLFRMFARVHPGESVEGTGIGLALCKKIVERHGGTIWIESAPGGGAAFRFTLPAA